MTADCTLKSYHKTAKLRYSDDKDVTIDSTAMFGYPLPSMFVTLRQAILIHKPSVAAAWLQALLIYCPSMCHAHFGSVYIRV